MRFFKDFPPVTLSDTCIGFTCGGNLFARPHLPHLIWPFLSEIGGCSHGRLSGLSGKFPSLGVGVNEMSTSFLNEVALSKAAITVVSLAADFWTVAYEVPATWRKVDGSAHVVVRGWSGERQFMAVWEDGKADCAYWWTREHRATAKLPDEVVEWKSPVPTPVKVSFAELKTLLKECGKV